jgi:hypothetical protein
LGVARRRIRHFGKEYGVAGSQSTRRPAPRSGQSNWWADAGNTVEDLKRRAEAKGREIYEEAIRLGRPIVAKTTADLIELGARQLMMDPRVAAARAAAKPLAKVAANPKVQEVAESVHRFVKGQGSSTANGAVDAFTMGGANHITAGVEALADSGLDFEQLGGAYRRHIAEERARDR